MSDLRHGDLLIAGFLVVALHAGEPGRFADQLGDVVVVGMRIADLMGENDLWFQSSKSLDHRGPFDVGHEHVSVRQLEVVADVEF